MKQATQKEANSTSNYKSSSQLPFTTSSTHKVVIILVLLKVTMLTMIYINGIKWIISHSYDRNHIIIYVYIYI